MVQITRRDALAGAGLVLLAGCGGGGNGGPPPTGSSPTPTPTPTPTPSPSPGDVGSFGTLGAATSQTFATLGYSQRGRGSGWDFIPEDGTLTSQPGHSMRFEVPKRLLLQVPTIGEGELVVRNLGKTFAGQLQDATFNVLGGICQLIRPIVAGRLQQYVMLGYFSSAPNANNAQANLLLTFAYGIPTAPGAVPVTGASDFATGYSEEGVGFRADYSAKVVTGALPFYTNGPTLKSQLRDVIISADGTTFAGRLIPPDGSPEGTIQGRFMGPTGEELIVLITLKSSIGVFSASRLP